MADSAQKRKGRMLTGAAASSSLFGSVVQTETEAQRVSAEIMNRVIRIKKSPNYLRLCIRTEGFPLSVGDQLFVNTRRKGLEPLYRRITVRGERTFVADDNKSFDSLTRAAAHIQNWRDPYKIETWTVVKVKSEKGLVTLNALFERNWRLLCLDLTTLEDADLINDIAVKNDHKRR